MNLKALFEAAKNDLAQNGYIGMDYNMAVLCIIAKREPTCKVEFMPGGASYQEKLEYWASKRIFCWLRVESEDELLAHALKEHKIN